MKWAAKAPDADKLDGLDSDATGAADAHVVATDAAGKTEVVGLALNATGTPDAGDLILTGKANWESAGIVDTNLYRSAANTLKTDDSLIVAGGLNVGTTGAGTGEIKASGSVSGSALNVGTTGAAAGDVKASGSVSGSALYFGPNDHIDEYCLRVGAGAAAETDDIPVPTLGSYLLLVGTGAYVGNGTRYYHLGVAYGRMGTANTIATLHGTFPGTPDVALSVSGNNIRVTYTGHATKWVDFTTFYILTKR
jgi:hypothetical protein